jgi:hypothetical protein
MTTELQSIITLLKDPASYFSALALLTEARRVAVSLKLHRRSEGEEDELYRPLCETPIHPLLLATALAKCIVCRTDIEAVIERYYEGAEISELEDRYILFGREAVEMNVDLILEVEASILENMMLLSLHRMFSIRNGPRLYFSHLLKSIEEGKPPDGNRVSMHTIRRATWHEFNPSLSVMLRPIVRDAILYNYGFSWNSKFHNAREYFTDKFGEVKSAINSALAGNESADTLKRLKRQYVQCTNLKDRANQFYWWNPCEIDAHEVGEAAEAAAKKRRYLARNDVGTT